jgi:hypothetical protein
MSFPHSHHPPNTRYPLSLKEPFLNLPKSLRDICGTVSFPDDNGHSLMSSGDMVSHLIGASNASYHNDKASHTWLISTSDKQDLLRPNKLIFGSGPVDGLHPFMSSGRGERHRLNAVSIVNNLLNTYHNCNLKIKKFLSWQRDCQQMQKTIY